MGDSGGHRSSSAVAVLASEDELGIIRGACDGLGLEVRVLKGPEEGIGDARMVLVDVTGFERDGLGLLERIKGDPATRGIPVGAFGNSLRADLLQDAVEAGADLVLPRAAFHKQLDGILRRWTRPDPRESA